jgi:hypothetical protein
MDANAGIIKKKAKKKPGKSRLFRPDGADHIFML